MKFKNYIEAQSGIKDSADSPGTLDQVLTSTATGVAWVDPSTISAEAATLVVIECKNTSGATITKGTPVYQTGTVGATDVIEIAPADALISAGKQPAIGLLQTTLNNNGFGKVVITGEFLNFTTDPIDGVTPTTGQKVFLKSGGGLTLTKPTGAENGIQNLGLIGKVSGGNAGSITVSSIMRTNDVPNLPTGKIWVGDGNTIVSDTVFLDEPNGRMGIGTTSPDDKLHVNQGSDAFRGITIEGTTPGLYLKDTQATNAHHIGSNGNYLYFLEDSNQSGGYNNILAFWDPSNNFVFQTGNVGIGTTSPGAKLDVNGEIRSDKTVNGISFSSTGGGASFSAFDVYTATNGGLLRLYDENGQTVNIDGRSASGDTYFNNGGNVGIGTTSPDAKLQVGGITDSNGSPGSFNIAGSYGVDSWARAYVVSNTNILSILQANNTALQNGGAYRVTGHIDGTGTDQSSRAVFWNQNGTWFCNVTGQSGASSNSISFLVDATTGLPSVKTYHANNYTVRVWHERINLNEGTGTDNSRHYFGADAYMTQIDNDISMFTATYSGNNTTGKLGIGTASPSEKLELSGSDNLSIKLSRNNTDTTYVTTLTNNYSSSLGTELKSGTYNILTHGNSVGTSLNFTNGAMTFDFRDSEKMRITDTGNVGIGTTSPSEKLEVIGRTKITQSGDALRINSSDANGPYVTWQNNGSNIGYIGAGYHLWSSPNNIATSLGIRAQTRLDLGIQSSVHMTMLDSGNVGIGTTSPTTPLHVDGIAQIVTGSDNAFYGGNYVRVFGNQNFGFRNTGGLIIANISMSGNSYFNGGNVGIGTTAPSQKLHVAGNMRLQNQFYDSTNSTGSNGQVLTKTSGGTIWADNKGLTPITPGGITATIVGETIEIAFNQSTTSNIDYYQVWSSDDGGDYGIIGQIAPADFSSTMTVVDTTFVTGGTMSYRVYAVKAGVYSPAGTVSKAYTVSALDVTNMTVVNLNTAYYVQYEKPVSRFIDHIEIWMDSQTTQAALNRSNATLVYSGQNASYMRSVGTSSNFHQFWVEVVTS